MIPVMQILAIKGLLGSLAGTRSPLFYAMGKPHANFHLLCMRVVILAVIIYPFTKYWGIVGTAIATLIPAILIDPFGLLLSCKLLKCTLWKTFQQLIVPLTAFIFSVVSMSFVKSIFSITNSFISLFTLLVIGVIIYLAYILLIDIFCGYGYRGIFKEYLKSFRIMFIRKRINI